MLINPLVFSLRQNGYCGNYVLFVSPCFTICEAGTSLDWDDDPKVGIFLKLQIQTLFFVGYPVVLALGVIKRHALQVWSGFASCQSWCTLQYILLGKMSGMMWLQTSFIMSSCSWETVKPPVLCCFSIFYCFVGTCKD